MRPSTGCLRDWPRDGRRLCRVPVYAGRCHGELEATMTTNPSPFSGRTLAANGPGAPDARRGKVTPPLWLVMLVVGVIVGVSMGRAQSLGLYLQPITDALAIGRELFGLAMALTQLIMGFGAPLSGGLIDGFGAGRIIAACVAATIAGLYFM